MKDSTPSLQEIYITACRNFDELTNRLLQGFSSAVDSALMGYSEQQAEALQRSTGASESQEREIAACLKESLDSVTQSVGQTIIENDRFLTHMEEELILSCKSLQQEINDLAESLLRSHNISSKVLLAKLSGQCDKSVDSVQQVSNRSKHALREQSNSIGTQFGESLVEKQGRQFADLMAFENQARKEIPDMLAAVIARGRLHEPKLSMLNRQQNDQIDSRIELLKLKISEICDSEIGRIVALSGSTEQKLRKTYEETKEKLVQTNETATKDSLAELEDAGSSSRMQISELLSNLRAEMMEFFDRSLTQQQDRQTGDQERAKQLAEELQNLIEDQRLIAAQKSTVVQQIIEEMRQVEDNFESKISKKSSIQLDRLARTCDTAINDISASRKSVGEKITNLSNTYMTQIQEEEDRILKIIERRLEKALGFIDQAVGEEG